VAMGGCGGMRRRHRRPAGGGDCGPVAGMGPVAGRGPGGGRRARRDGDEGASGGREGGREGMRRPQ
jgi:hypothetical protein